jgi:hypothetical protein
MSKKRYIFLFISLISLLIFFLYITTVNSGGGSNSNFTSQTTNKINALEECINKKTIKNSGVLEETFEDDNQLTVLNLWYNLDKQDENISVRLNSRINDAKKIGFNSRILPILKQGDKLQLPVIDNKKYILDIKSINKKGNNALEVYGEFSHNGKIYASTLSLTKKSMLALLSTPTGNFDIRMANDKGYIYRSNQGESIVDLPSFLD